MDTMSASDAAPLPRLGEVFFDVRGNSRTLRGSWYAGAAPGWSYGEPRERYEEAPDGYGTPDETRSGYGTPDETRSGYGTPDETRSGYGTPDETRSGYGTPDETRSGYGTPDETRS